MRIIFMGSPDFAVPSLEALLTAGHEVVAAYCQPPRAAGRGKSERKTAVHERAEALGGADGPYALQAALAACHARAPTADATDWPRIARLYDRLGQVLPSPVVELNRAVAHAMAFGPAAGLALLAPLEAVETLRDYAPLSAAKGDFLFRAGRLTQARIHFERAAALSRNEGEKSFLRKRAAACG